MSGSSKGGASESLYYYGTIYGAIGWGPLDWFNAIIQNGGYLFQGALTLTSDVTDLTGSLADPTMVGPGGYLKLYRGTETQPVDGAISGPWRYPGTAYLAGKNIFFGQDSGQPPNWQVIAGRIPRVSTSIVAAIDNIADDGQVNPIAVLAELLIDERGANFPTSIFDTTSWLAAAHWCAQDAAHRAYTFVSPLIDQQASLRELTKRLLDPFNGFLRWTKDGKLACVIYEWGVDPGGLLTLDAQTWTRKPKMPLGDWTNVPTELVVSFTDRDYEYQTNTVLVPNARAAQIRQVDDQQHLDWPDAKRIEQAHRRGVEYHRRMGTAPSTFSLEVRGPIVAGLSPGDKVKVDVDPEPGGSGLAQLCRVEKIEQSPDDKATLTVMTDALLPATPYTPTWATPTAPDTTVAPIAHALAIPLPIDVFGWPPQAAFVAARASGDTRGFTVFIAQHSTDAFDEVGHQTGFAVRATLAADITSGATTANLTQTDGLGGPDANLAAQTPGGNQAAAQDDTLVAILAQLDVNGRIALSGGVPVMEFVSIVDRAPVSGSTYSYTILRGRLGTAAAAWAAASTVVWIVPRSHLFGYDHGLLTALQGSLVYFRLQSYNDTNVDESLTLTEADLNLPPISAPTGLVATPGTGKTVGLKWSFTASGSFTGEFGIYRNTVNDFSTATKIAEVSATKFVDVEVAFNTTYYYWVVAINPEEVESATSAVAPATTGDVRVGLIPAPAAPSALTFDSSGTYGPTKDGNILAWMKFLLPSFPATTTKFNILTRVSGTDGRVVQDQKSPGDTIARIDDLACALNYDFGICGISADGNESADVWIGPLTTPAKTTPPAALSGITAHSPSSSWPIPAKYYNSAVVIQMLGGTVSFNKPSDLDYDGGEYALRAFGTGAPSVADGVYGPNDTSIQCFLPPVIFTAMEFWYRNKNRSGVFMAWTNSGVDVAAVVGPAAGSLSVQDSDSANVSGLQIGNASASSVRQVMARFAFNGILTAGSTAAAVKINVSLTNRGFNTKPDVALGQPTATDNNNVLWRYDWDDASNSSTNAVIEIFHRDGTNVTSGEFHRFSIEFVEYA